MTVIVGCGINISLTEWPTPQIPSAPAHRPYLDPGRLSLTLVLPGNVPVPAAPAPRFARESPGPRVPTNSFNLITNRGRSGARPQDAIALQFITR